MTSEQCQAELTRICESICKKAGPDGSDVERGLNHAGATYRILRWLGKQNLTDPLFRCDTDKLFLHTLARKSERENWDRAPDATKTESRSSTRRIVVDARIDLDKFYKTEGTPNGVKVTLPKTLRRTEPSPSRKGPYGLRFVQVEGKSDNFSGADRRTLTLTESLWSKMITLEKRQKALLVFPTDPDRLRNKHLDLRGLRAGSGEVAGAFALGGAMGELWKCVDVSRSNDVNLKDLRDAPCLILLGSSIKNKVFQDFRAGILDDPCWPNQEFTFAEINNDNGDKVGAVKRGSVNHPYVVDSFAQHEIDYALISYFRHSGGERSLIALQGISTVATRAAAEYLSTDDSVQELYRKLKLDSNAKTLPSFELLLEVSVREYIPAKTKYADHIVHRNSEHFPN